MEVSGAQKYQCSNSLVNWEKCGIQPKLTFKNPIFRHFHE